MTDPARPAHMRLYCAAISALPLPGEPMTVAAYEKIRDLLWADANIREPQDADADSGEKDHPEKDAPNRGTDMHRGDSLASSEMAWVPTIKEPDTVTFGFGRQGR